MIGLKELSFKVISFPTGRDPIQCTHLFLAFYSAQRRLNVRIALYDINYDNFYPYTVHHQVFALSKCRKSRKRRSDDKKIGDFDKKMENVFFN